MKKIFFSLLAIAALASCAKTEAVYEETQSEIKLAPVAALQTKANVLAAIDGTAYPTAENFDVYGYYKNVGAGEVYTDGQSYFGGAVEFTNKGNYWGGVETYYWPKNGALRFAAYSPSSLNIEHSQGGDTFSGAYIQPSKTNETWDFLVAPTSESYTAMTAAENVSIVFEHALSWITLQVKAKDAAAENVFTIKSVTINDVNTTADFKASMLGQEMVQYESWSNQATAADYVVFDGEQGVTGEAKVIETTPAGTLVIPQTTTKVTVVFDQKGVNGTLDMEDMTVTLDLVLDQNDEPWKPGYHYTYTLIFGLDEILINPSVDTWEEYVWNENGSQGEIETDKTVANVATEEQLVAALAKGGKVVLQNNITITETLNVTNTVVLELNGYTLTNQAGNATTDVIVVAEGGELTINGEGTVEAVSGNDGYAVISKGLLIINGGTYKAGIDQNGEANAVIYARENGKVYVNGGTFPNDANSVYVLNKRDADRATTVISVAGGSYKNFNPGDNAAENPKESFLKDGFGVAVDGDWYTVVLTNVATADQLAAALAYPAEVKLTNDIDMTGYEWTPAGTAEAMWCGVLDGQGHKITGLELTGDYAALVAYAGEGAVIKDLTLENVNVESTKYGAALICVAENNVTVENVTVSGSVNATAYAAGLVLMNNDDSDVVYIKNCENNATVTSQRAGGIAAWVTGGAVIENVVNNGDITGSISACGITNRIGGTIKNAVNNGNITGNGTEPSAGIAGIQTSASTFEYCFNYGTVTTTKDNANASAAGILGQTPSKAATFNYCANYGAITAEQSYAAGIAYSLYGNIKANYCYNEGAINGADGAGAIAPKAQYGAGDTASYCLNAGTVASSNGKVYQGSNKNTSSYYYSNGSLLNVSNNAAVAEADALAVLNGGADADFFALEGGVIVVK